MNNISDDFKENYISFMNQFIKAEEDKIEEIKKKI